MTELYNNTNNSDNISINQVFRGSTKLTNLFSGMKDFFLNWFFTTVGHLDLKSNDLAKLRLIFFFYC